MTIEYIIDKDVRKYLNYEFEKLRERCKNRKGYVKYDNRRDY